jgi:thymidylate synthase
MNEFNPVVEITNKITNIVDRQYLGAVQYVLENGESRDDRTGVGTLSVFGYTCRYDLREGFPIVTTKEVLWRNAVLEILWMMSSSNKISELGSKIWDSWADSQGTIGRSYSKQFRQWRKFDFDGLIDEIDQVKELIDSIKTDPASRRHIVSAWNTGELNEMVLPPCHILWQAYVSGIDNDHPKGQYLDLMMYQRSADLALGVPFNIVGYAFLMHILAKECNLIPRYFIHNMGDMHIYKNHIQGLQEQLTREPYPSPTLVLPDVPFWDLVYKRHELIDQIRLDNYKYHPRIKFPVAV